MSGTRGANDPKKGSASRKPRKSPTGRRGIVKQVFAIGQPNDWRTWLQRFLVVSIVFVLVCVGAFFVAYEATTIPDPNAAFQTQSTYVYYANGRTELGTFATQNRQSVPLTQVAQPMQDAAVAAEDRTFWTNKGIDIKSIFRSVFNTAQGTTQGGSTITMQYVKILYLNQAQTITRKVKQIFLALKIQQQESKQQILEGYLNTIYFGRGAYGIQAASETYFGVPASKLTPAQAALLAAEINEPSYLDPTGTAAQRSALFRRYQYVLDGMVTMGTLNSGTKDTIYSKLPKVRPQSSVNVFGGQRGFALSMVKSQLLKLGFTEAQIYGSGLRVTTTLTPKAMSAAETGVSVNKPGGLKQLHVGTASVDVKTGALLGFFAGQDYLKSQYNWVTAPNPPGSVFKVPALAAALSNGWSLKNTFDGNSPLDINGTKIQNEGEASGIANGTSYGPSITLLQGLVESINTVYVDMTNATQNGPNKIKNMLTAMGVPADAPGLTYKGSNGQPVAPTTIALGSASVSPLDIANAYASIANGGMAHPWYMISKVTDSSGKVLWKHQDHQTRAMSAKVAADVSYAMQQVVARGTASKNGHVPGRDTAGKTGTATGLKNAHVITSWFAGFTPQVATAVIYLRTNPTNGAYLPLDGYMPSYFGADYPTATWASIMTRIMAGLPFESFPPPGNVQPSNNTPGHQIYTPPPSPTFTPTPTPTPTPRPTRTPKPTPTPSSSSSPSSPPPPSNTTGVLPCPSRAMTESTAEPTHEDSLAATLSDRFGGAAGNHGGVRPDGTPGGHWWWTPLRVVLAVVTLTFCLSLVHEKPCIGTAWGNDAVRYSKACYSDIPYLYTGRGFATQQWPYAARDPYQRMEYPVGTSYFAWFASRVTALAPAGPMDQLRNSANPNSLWGLPGMTDEVSEYFVITAVLLFGFVLAATWFLTRANPRRPWDGLMFAASPVLAATALINWDLLAVAASAGALWAWSRRHPIWLGVFIGLGTAFKLYPLLLLGGVIALALRDRSRIRPALLTAAAAVASWVLLQAPAWIGSLSAWKYFWAFNSNRGPDWGSLWLIAQHAGANYGTSTMNLIQWVTMGIVCAGVAVLAKWAPTKPSLAQLGYLLTVGFLITNKVYSPQYVLWLLPLAVLARPRWRDQLIWQACELFYFFMIWWDFGGYLNLNSGDTFWLYAVAIFVRIAGEVYLVVMILLDLLSYDSVEAFDHAHAVDGGDQPELVS